MYLTAGQKNCFENIIFLQKSLYVMFKTDKNFLKEKGAYLIRQLSVFIGPENIYKSMAEAIGKEEDIKFARLLVEHLNSIMFTSAELSSLREQIKLLSTPVRTATLNHSGILGVFHCKWSFSAGRKIHHAFLNYLY